MSPTTTRRTCWPLAAAQPDSARPRPSWAEWCAWQAKRAARQRHFGDLPFSDRELAHLAFVRWLYQTGRILP